MRKSKKEIKKYGILDRLQDVATLEFKENGYPTKKYIEVTTIKMLMEEALGDNQNIYIDGKKMEICKIPSLVLKYGTDFDREGIASRLRGLQINYGEELISVCTTLDLNHATIHDIKDLLFEIGV